MFSSLWSSVFIYIYFFTFRLLLAFSDISFYSHLSETVSVSDFSHICLRPIILLRLGFVLTVLHFCSSLFDKDRPPLLFISAWKNLRPSFCVAKNVLSFLCISVWQSLTVYIVLETCQAYKPSGIILLLSRHVIYQVSRWRHCALRSTASSTALDNPFLTVIDHSFFAFSISTSVYLCV